MLIDQATAYVLRKLRAWSETATGDSELGGGVGGGGFCVYVTYWGRNQLGTGLWCQCFVLKS